MLVRTMMTRIFAALTLSMTLLLGAPAAADEAAKPAITQTIQNQLDAFLKDDFDTAFTYASPTIQGLFGSSSNFGAMVQQGYPMVHRPSDVRFLDLRSDGGRLVQKVQVRDAKGQVHLLEYQMVQAGNAWKINGVQLLKGQGLSA